MAVPPILSNLSITTTLSPPPPPSTFTFPRDYHFPPFFSSQPNLTTLFSQRQKWGNLIQAYCRAHRIFKLSLVDAIDTDLFHNRKINKRLAIYDAREMVEFLRSVGRAEWLAAAKDGAEGRNTAWIYWRNVEEWATLIFEWVEDTAQKNTVLTLYELTQSEATLSQEFHGMDPELLQKALNFLVKRGKAQVFGQEDQLGVKFF